MNATPLTVSDLAGALGLPASAPKAEVLRQLATVVSAAETVTRLVALNSRLEAIRGAIAAPRANEQLARDFLALKAQVGALQMEVHRPRGAGRSTITA